MALAGQGLHESAPEKFDFIIIIIILSSLSDRPVFGVEILLPLSTARLEPFGMHCARVREERDVSLLNVM